MLLRDAYFKIWTKQQLSRVTLFLLLVYPLLTPPHHPSVGQKPFVPMFSLKFDVENLLSVKHCGNGWGLKLLAAFLKESAFTALEFHISCQGKLMPWRGWVCKLWAEGRLREKWMFLHGWALGTSLETSLLLCAPRAQRECHIHTWMIQTLLTGREIKTQPRNLENRR